MTDLTVDSTAREMLAALSSREISCSELMDLHLARIAERNPELNAIVCLDEERARDGASEADRTPYDERGPLHGLPWAFKDTHDVAGWLTTYGSPLLADNVPARDELVVERIRRAGAVPIGKTNVPEFAAGSHTFNPVFGTTVNPVDPTRSAGGSSGGAACALAAGMVPLADGSDMGGSLRNPASFCGVVGLRPSRGRVPAWPSENQWEAPRHLRAARPQRGRPGPGAVGPRGAGPAGAARPRRARLGLRAARSSAPSLDSGWRCPRSSAA